MDEAVRDAYTIVKHKTHVLKRSM